MPTSAGWMKWAMSRLAVFDFAVGVERGGTDLEFAIERQPHPRHADHLVAAILRHLIVKFGGDDDKFNIPPDQVIHQQDQYRDDPIHFWQKRLGKKRYAHES